MKTLADLTIGDEVVYSYGGIGAIPQIKRIDRITTNHIVVSGQKFRKKSGYRAGEGCGHISVPDDETRKYIAEETTRRRCLRAIRNANFDRMTTDALLQIAALIPAP